MKHTTETYIEDQVSILDEDSKNFSFQLRDNAGNKTNFLSVNPEQFEKIVTIIKDKEYPFNEGDTYWTIEEIVGSNLDGSRVIVVLESCWNDQSEEIHDQEPDKIYYQSKKHAGMAHKWLVDRDQLEAKKGKQHHCPSCGGDHLEMDSFVYEGDHGHFPFTCFDCEKEGKEVYLLNFYESSSEEA